MRRHSVVRAVSAVLCCTVLAACGGGKDSTSPDVPIPASISLQPAGDALQFDAVGATVQLTAKVVDQHGQPMTQAAVKFESSDKDVASVSSTGLVTTVANGTAKITATAGGVKSDASIKVAQRPHTLTAVSGDQQAGVPGEPLADPLVVRLDDRLGHPIAGVEVTFASDAGSGSVSPATPKTDANGKAQASWTAGAGEGTQTASAVVAGLDSVHFTATVKAPTPPSPLQITPDTLVEGASATITGITFSTTATNNSVIIDGVRATVGSATATTIHFVVPKFPCQPARTVTVSVHVITGTPNPSVEKEVPIRPETYTSLAVGEEALVQDPSKFCFQLERATGTRAPVYVMGLSAPAEAPSAVLPFKINVRSGAPVLASTGLAAQRDASPLATWSRSTLQARQAPMVKGALPAALASRRAEVEGQLTAESRIRRWEEDNVSALATRFRARGGNVSAMRTLASVGPSTAVGDTVNVRVPLYGSNDLCSSYTTVRAAVRVIGTSGIWLQDVANPTTDSLTLADIQAASNQFDSKIYATDTRYFGNPSDVDGNGRVLVLLTKEVNKTSRLLGFVFAGDLFGGDPTCPSSNGAEIYYGEVPDPNNVLGTGVRQKATVVKRMPNLISHEFTHVIQFSRRLILNSGVPLASWEAEGQATLAEELVGHAVLGNSPGQNYDRSVAFGPAGYDWYSGAILKWMTYFGSLGSNNQAANAPDLCTVYGSVSLTDIPCDMAAFYGASWSLQRYIADQYAASYPGGMEQLTRDWVSKYPTSRGTANIGKVLGVDYDKLFARFATATALDDQSNYSGTAWVPREFSITSWNSSDISAWLDDCCKRAWLNPPVMSFATASASRSVRGGSTAYTVLSAGTTYDGTSFQVTDLAGNPVSNGLHPALWIARIQ